MNELRAVRNVLRGHGGRWRLAEDWDAHPSCTDWLGPVLKGPVTDPLTALWGSTSLFLIGPLYRRAHWACPGAEELGVHADSQPREHTPTTGARPPHGGVDGLQGRSPLPWEVLLPAPQSWAQPGVRRSLGQWGAREWGQGEMQWVSPSLPPRGPLALPWGHPTSNFSGCCVQFPSLTWLPWEAGVGLSLTCRPLT